MLFIFFLLAIYVCCWYYLNKKLEKFLFEFDVLHLCVLIQFFSEALKQSQLEVSFFYTFNNTNPRNKHTNNFLFCYVYLFLNKRTNERNVLEKGVSINHHAFWVEVFFFVLFVVQFFMRAVKMGNEGVKEMKLAKCSRMYRTLFLESPSFEEQ